MSMSEEPPGEEPAVHREYVLGVRITECDDVYRFEALDHRRVEFDDPEAATLYADVYFDVNGFVEADTGDRGIPPEIVQGGRDDLAAYLMTWPETDVNWVGSFLGRDPGEVQRLVAGVRRRAGEIRAGIADRK